jgi:hypothetical protein
VDIVCLQHEFGIFGGPAPGHILAFLRELRMPVVTTLRTVLREPRTDQRRVMQELISLSTRLVVMAEPGRQMLEQIYHAPLAKIDLITHGIPDVGFVNPTYFKDQFGVEGRVVFLTFGLLSPKRESNTCSTPYRIFWRSFRMLFTLSWVAPIPTNCANVAKHTG